MSSKLTSQDVQRFLSMPTVGFAKVGIDGRYIYTNETYAHVLGFDSALDLVGTLWIEPVDPLEKEKARVAWDQMLETGKSRLEIKTSVGGITVMVETARGESGYYCVLQQSKNNDEWYKELYRKTPMMLHSVDRDGRVLNVSDRWLEKLGYTREEVIGRHLTEFMTDESKARFQVALAHLMKKGNVCVGYQIFKKNGEILDIVLSSAEEVDPQGHFLRSFTILQDTTEFNKESELIKRFYSLSTNNDLTIAEKIKNILDMSLSYLGLHSACVGQVTDQQYLVLYNLTKTDTKLPTLGTSFPLSDTYCEATYRLNRVIAHYDASKDEIAQLPCYKRRQFNAYIGCPLYMGGEKFGVISFFSEMSRDTPFSKREKDFVHFIAQCVGNKLAQHQFIEKLQQSEVQLKQAIQALEKSNEELEHFAYVCSHDLQEPLRMVSSFSGLLKARLEQGHKFDDKESHYLGRIETNARQAQMLISDLLSYAKIQKDPVNQSTKVINLEELVLDILAGLEACITEKNTKIVVNYLPSVQGNSIQVFQLFQNLISNALKFSCPKGPLIEIGERDGTFFVQDNGIGIAPEYHRKIFEIFQRLDKKHYSGTGIGLAICKKIVEEYGGKIWCKSDIGQGACFYFTLPRALEKIQAKQLEVVT